MNDKKRGGFIPLIAIIIMGVVALAGGTVATVSIIKNKERSAQSSVVVEQAEERLGDTAIQRDIKTDSEDTTSEPATSQLPETPKKITRTPDEITRLICASLKDEQVQIWCSRLSMPFDDTSERRAAWQRDVDRIKKAAQVQAEVDMINKTLKEAEPFYHGSTTTP
ncbi:MAG: hypothetical protein LiPW15_618 [Parcubacteria group bacterium LiPW_15]|nr:MAG: hypothetical protein LiPW15_618 [Parcubacteria group bacterium LiPW_15]